jgi:hypothetical protein
VIIGVTALSRGKMLAMMRVPWTFTYKVAVVSITDNTEPDEIGDDFGLGNWVDTEIGRFRLQSRGVDDAISLCFGDFGENEIRNRPELLDQVLTAEQARKLIQFLDRVHARPGSVFMAVHCGAGISRSAGVAEFVVERYHLDWNRYVEKHQHTQPNHHVLRTLRAVALALEAEHAPTK